MDDHDKASSIDGSAVRRRLDVEIGEVRAAIALVARGTSSHVRLTGLVFGDALIARLSAEAARDGVRLVPDYRPEDAGCDVSVVARDA
jgi:hypothetical protein